MSNLKLSTLLGGAIASSLLLTACGGGSSSSESTPQPTPTVPANPVQTALLSGTVISKASSTPIAGATISVDQLSVTTDKDGKYTLSNLPTGNKNITVSANGFISQTIQRNLVANTNKLDMALVPVAIVAPPSLLSAISLSPSNTFEAYESDYQLSNEKASDDFYIDSLLKVVNGKIQTATDTNILRQSNARNLATILGDHFYSTLDIKNANTNQYVLGLDGNYYLFKDPTTNKEILLHNYLKEYDLSGKDVVNGLIGNPLDSLDLEGTVYPNGSKCWADYFTSTSSNVYAINLDAPNEYTSIDEWKKEITNNGSTPYVTEINEKVGTNNEYNAIRLGFKIPNSSEIVYQGMVTIDGKFYTAAYSIANSTPPSNPFLLDCQYMNKTMRDFVVSNIKSYYGIK